MRRDYFAHTPTTESPDRWHLLSDHLKTTGSLCQKFALSFDASDLMLQIGLLHDIGKYSDEFQDYLIKCDQFENKKLEKRPKRGSAHHKETGGCFAIGQNQKYGEFIAACIYGHHGGLQKLGGKWILNQLYNFEKANASQIETAV